MKQHKRQLTITMGLPACGKSTWAAEQVRNDTSNVIVVNADALRKSIFDAFWQRDRSIRNITEGFVAKSINEVNIS